jgi:hypothetical protein
LSQLKSLTGRASFQLSAGFVNHIFSPEGTPCPYVRVEARKKRIMMKSGKEVFFDFMAGWVFM